MSVLECHSKGDKRFSAFYAKIKVKGKLVSIENFYQNSKKAYDGHKVQKGEMPDYIEIFSKKIPKEYLGMFYDLMWYQYFLENPNLYEYAKTFDDYLDIFKGKSINNQEKTIRKCCKNGLNFVKNECKDILDMLDKNDKLPVIKKNLMLSNEKIIGHQVNCKGVMGRGVALDLKQTHFKVFQQYKDYCLSNECGTILLGQTQFIEDGDKIFANLFGQYTYGTKCKQTLPESFEKALINLYNYAKTNNYSVSIPYKIGCNLGGGDWEEIENIIIKVFHDYPIVLYKK